MSDNVTTPFARAIDAHTAGEPLRLIVAGYPPISGDTMAAKRQYVRRHLDHLRTALILEPRGHAEMYGAVLTDPVTADGDYGILFLHNAGYSSMCGHGVIAVATILIESGMRAADPGESTVLRFDTPAGRVTAAAAVDEGRVVDVSFANVPSFVVAVEQRVHVPHRGEVVYDLAFGGAFYAVCDAAPLQLELTPSGSAELIAAGRQIKQAIETAAPIAHPAEPDLGFLYGVIFTGPAADRQHHSRNACVFADGQLDRSPTGTGVSARAALLLAAGKLGVGERITIESVLGTTFTVEVEQLTEFHGRAAVIPRVGGAAFLTGHHQFVSHDQDPLAHGFCMGR